MHNMRSLINIVVNDHQILKESTTGTDNVYVDDEKYNLAVVPEITRLPVSAIERQEMDFRPEVTSVSDDVAANMDFSEPVEVTAFRYSKNNDDAEPKVQLVDGHHRYAAAIQTGREWLPVKVSARNAKGYKLNALIALSDNLTK